MRFLNEICIHLHEEKIIFRHDLKIHEHPPSSECNMYNGIYASYTISYAKQHVHYKSDIKEAINKIQLRMYLTMIVIDIELSNQKYQNIFNSKSLSIQNYKGGYYNYLNHHYIKKKTQENLRNGQFSRIGAIARSEEDTQYASYRNHG